LQQDYELLKETLSESKSILDSIKDTKLAMKTQFENIQEFYGEIESYKKKIADIKKEADDNFNHLNEECAKSTSEHTLKTRSIIETNQNLYGEIKAHLRNAISGTLFSAFSVRSGKLGKSKWAWAAILAICVAVGVSLTIMIAHDLSGKPDQAFFVKLSAMLPVLFLLGFSAKQYTNERRAEEEYAFKSTISISLDSYRELLERITKEQGIEAAAFVKKLIEEVFDNPVKRIYPLKESLGEMKEENILNVKEMLSNLTDIPAEQMKSVETILKQVMSVIKIK
jgi:hypothetical protein